MEMLVAYSRQFVLKKNVDSSIINKNHFYVIEIHEEEKSDEEKSLKDNIVFNIGSFYHTSGITLQIPGSHYQNDHLQFGIYDFTLPVLDFNQSPVLDFTKSPYEEIKDSFRLEDDCTTIICFFSFLLASMISFPDTVDSGNKEKQNFEKMFIEICFKWFIFSSN